MDEVIEAQGEDEGIVEVCFCRIEGNEGCDNQGEGVEEVEEAKGRHGEGEMRDER
jgi:hypothetical protein